MNHLTTQHTSSIILALCIACILLISPAKADGDETEEQRHQAFLQYQEYLNNFKDVTYDMASLTGYWSGTRNSESLEYVFINKSHFILTGIYDNIYILKYKPIKQYHDSHEYEKISKYQPDNDLIRIAAKGLYCGGDTTSEYHGYKDLIISNNTTMRLEIERIFTNYFNHPDKNPDIDTMNATELWNLFKETDNVGGGRTDGVFHPVNMSDVPQWFRDKVAKAIALETPDCSVMK